MNKMTGHYNYLCAMMCIVGKKNHHWYYYVDENTNIEIRQIIQYWRN